MSTIRDIRNPWRDQLLPASYRGAEFRIEAGSKESGKRVVLHEFPKRDVPYAESMGRKAYEFSVRGYCISYPFDTGGSLQRRDYRIGRDRLLEALDREGDGVLQLPLMPPMYVMCQRYRVTEEQKLGGYCAFDMQFCESGRKQNGLPFSRDGLLSAAQNLQGRVTNVMDARPSGNTSTGRAAGPV